MKKVSLFASLAAALTSAAWGTSMYGKALTSAAPSRNIHTPGRKKTAKATKGGMPKERDIPKVMSKGIPGVPRGYQNSQGKPVGFNVNGVRGAGVR